MLAAPAVAAAEDPCAAARVRLGKAALAALGTAARDVEAYRAAWRDACHPAEGAADLSTLLGDTEALVEDVRLRRLVLGVVRTLEPGAPWPLPGMRSSADGVALDWEAFQVVARNGTAEDGRFFRGAARVLDDNGEPVWLGPAAPDGAPCVRLTETSWTEIADGLLEMERADARPYAAKARDVRERLLETFRTLSGGGAVCGCVRGDPLPALDALAARADERGAPPPRRSVAAAARDAARALRGMARVEWLRPARGAPATGCMQAQR